jgi:hypothetical protein
MANIAASVGLFSIVVLVITVCLSGVLITVFDR